MKHSEMMNKLVEDFMKDPDEVRYFASNKYRAELYILEPSELIDEYEATFGVRETLDVDSLDEPDDEMDEWINSTEVHDEGT